MKKVIYTFILIFMFIGIVNAAQCVAINGNGENIGDEIDCGGEHFYVLDVDGDNVKLFAKYNLLAGRNYSQLVLNENITNIGALLANESVQEKINEGYIVAYHENIDGKTLVYLYKEVGKDFKIVASNSYDEEEIYQSERFRELLREGYYYDKYYVYGHYSDYHTEDTKYLVFVKDETLEYRNFVSDECPFVEHGSTFNQRMEEIFPGYLEAISIGDPSSQYYSYGYNTQGQNMCALTIIYNRIGYKEMKQDSRALGAHGSVRGVAEYPEYGSLFVTDYYAPDGLQHDIINADGVDYGDFNLENESRWKMVLTSYEDYLKSLDIPVKEINILAISDINTLTKKITDKELPLDQWTIDWEKHYYGNESAYIIGSLIDNLPEEYSWLWSTTYWTRTAFKKNYVYFVDIWGDMCTAYYCSVDVGAGLRPVITLSLEDVVAGSTQFQQDDEKPEQPNPDTGDLISILLSILIIAGGFILLAQTKKNYYG